MKNKRKWKKLRMGEGPEPGARDIKVALAVAGDWKKIVVTASDGAQMMISSGMCAARGSGRVQFNGVSIEASTPDQPPAENEVTRLRAADLLGAGAHWLAGGTTVDDLVDEARGRDEHE